MKLKNILVNFLLVIALFITTGCLVTSCDDWTEPEAVRYETIIPDQQNPEQYALYTQAIRNFKEREHSIVCVRFANGSSDGGEKDFLRALPDSIDAVILEHPETLSTMDLDDCLMLQQNFSTKILYGFNLTNIKKDASVNSKELNDLLSSELDKMITSIEENELDGASILYHGEIDLNNSEVVTIHQVLFEKIASLVNAGKTFFFEGNPLFIPQKNRDLFSLYVLSTTSASNANHLQLLIEQATDYANISLGKLLLTADIEKMNRDNNNRLVPQVPFITEQVINSGPVKGLMIQNTTTDYHTYPDVTYWQIRNAIQLLNPSPIH